MQRSRVVVIACESYQPDRVGEAVARGIELLGGISCFVQAGERILLKPNLLVGDRPEKGVTTHPQVLLAVGQIFKEGKAALYFGDSPGLGKPGRAAQQAGFKAVADTLGMKLADFQTGITVSFPEALLAKQLVLAAGALEADGIISLSKMKTHGFTRITGAVKNQFGCIPGLRKAEYHVKMPDVFDFSRVLVDINRYLNPRLYIMDGIVAMEGNGPRGGDLIDMNVLLFSTDPVALDAVCCRLIDLEPEFVPTAKIGREAGLGTYSPGEIEILGDDLENLINKKFSVVRRPPEPRAASRFYPGFLKRWISPRPVINRERCVNCGQCVLQCPVNPKAIDWPQGNQKEKPVYDYQRCIRCYCCQEICPEKAITVNIPLMGRLIYR